MAVNPIGPAPLPAKSEPMTVSPTVAVANQWANKGNITAFDDKDGPSFSDFLDIINPLQHIPIINTIYQKLTGDTEGAVADLVGGALYGGVIGLGAAIAGLVVRDSTGKSIEDNVVAMFTDDSSGTAIAQKEQPTNTASAQSDQPPPPAAAPTEPVSTSPLSSIAPTPADGPVRAGDYLIFGSGSPAPIAVPTASSALPTSLVPSTSAGPAKQGDFLVFGANGVPPATSLPETNISMLTTPAAAAAPAELPQQAQAAAAAEPHFRPVPPRNGTTRTPMALPMPTTGPGALPGGHSQAVGQGGASYQVGNPMNSFSDATPTSPTGLPPGDAKQWFNGAFSQAMDKYQRAARLKGDANDQAPMMPPSAIGAGTAAAAAPIN